MARDKAGRFVAGPDQDRHTFTLEEQRRGYRTAELRMAGRLGLLDGPQWLLIQVKRWYRSRR